MKEKFKKQVASLALSMAITGSSAVAMSVPVYADDESDNKEIEQFVDDEIQEEQGEEVEKEVKEERSVEVLEEEAENYDDEEVVEKEDESIEIKSEMETEEIEENEIIEEESENIEFVSEKTVAAGLKSEENSQNTEESTTQTHTVAVITNKVDSNGNYLSGATLQIIDSNGVVVDEWVSDGTEHISLLPEGTYTLHEKSAPEGYTVASDQSFTIKVETKDIIADVEHDNSHDVCWHYGGVALYYIESEGERDEVYCVNQDWEEPNGVNYNGLVLDENNIRTFTPDADTSMSNKELYDKVLDIIYHRTKAEELFPELSETEIRFITEYALKTYTSAEVTTRQAMRDENGRIIRDDEGNIVYEDIRFLRYYRYDPTSPKGYVIDPINGDGIGKLAEHWYNQHGHSRIPEEYVAFFYYLINNEERHPEDMFLYIYSTKNPTVDGESYQNLLGVRWFDPYDEEYKTYLTVINDKENIPPETPEEPSIPKEPNKSTSPQTGDNSFDLELALAGLGVSSIALAVMAKVRKRELDNEK